MGEPTKERGGRRKRIYQVTAAGKTELKYYQGDAQSPYGIRCHNLPYNLVDAKFENHHIPAMGAVARFIDFCREGLHEEIEGNLIEYRERLNP